ncbi:MAG: VIT1/CCC1 transporter family protein [Chloroflexi bacterium]|nr:VIT1/CCC1 transporter family protein [Chloroflexota bacterium]
MATPADIARYRANWQKEIDGAFQYRSLAASEKNGKLAEVYAKLAGSEEKHAAVWEMKLEEAGKPVPPRKPSWQARTLGQLARWFGPKLVLQTIVGNEASDSRAYDNQPEAETVQMAADEKSHARLLVNISGTESGNMGGSVAMVEGRHRSAGGNALRAAVLGANDGLVSILSLVMGVAGANMANSDVLIAGLAGLLAGAGSMAMGEWLSVQSSRELYEHQIAIEKAEIAEHPEEEQEELALIYQSKGLPEERARELAARIMADKNITLDTLAREELGIDPGELGGSAWEAASTSFLLFAFGAVFPILPFFFLDGMSAVYTSLAVSAVGLFIIGAAITLMTGRNLFQSGFRQVLFGLSAAALTYGVGKLIGVSLAG